ncbi:transglutaminase-like domain-containing protein [Nocardia asteroides]|uniref:transglutaminase-like domain-containing protein n=1 Tax=Nocardia asteroides TaxID=1824 RepID=UPI001E4ADE27|nr:transglutaminase-like domain-containing protein [Nocardia asteroides]UGT62575.1 transglutaminase-like domain-containing protein [Nocardia asteroides]
MTDLSHYSTQSRVTDPGARSALLAGLTGDFAQLRRTVSGLVIHYRADSPLAKGVPAQRMREIDTRYIETMLSRLAELAGGSLDEPRRPAQRLVGCCRDFTVLYVAALRARGIPARARVGFATYFVADYAVDHEVAEVWDADRARWRLVDPELDDGHTGPDGTRIDPLDLIPDQFVPAGAAWQLCRTGNADPARFVVDPGLDIPETHGMPQIAHNLVHDLAALNCAEMLLWDEWGWGENRSLTDSEQELLDRVAAVTTGGDSLQARRLYEDEPLLRVPDTVTSVDPLGGPPRTVTWR